MLKSLARELMSWGPSDYSAYLEFVRVGLGEGIAYTSPSHRFLLRKPES